jgi:hypothetical protein
MTSLTYFQDRMYHGEIRSDCSTFPQQVTDFIKTRESSHVPASSRAFVAVCCWQG